jgi:hypothetical protein
MAMDRSLRALTALVLFPLLAAAQNVTVPESLDGVEGGGGTSIPFGSSQACRYQCLYEVQELPWSGPRLITGIRIRPDLNSSGTTVPAKGFLEVSVVMSTTSRTASTMSSVFADNYGTDATLVIDRQLIQLPAQPSQAAGPMPANIALTFTQPWAYGLTPVVSGLPTPTSLLVEIHIHSQPSGLYRIDNLSSCSAQLTPFGLRGPACAVGGQPLTLTAGATMLAGSSYSWQVGGPVPDSGFMVALSFSDNGGLFGNPAWPVPYPMWDQNNPGQTLPGTAALQFPAPDCWVNIVPLAFLGGVTDASGNGSVSLVLPAGTQFVGTTIYTQAVLYAPTANPLRMITSQALGATICGPLGVARNSVFYNNPPNPPTPVVPPTSGTIQLGVGMVFEVQ